ncbi:MAG: RHS repeat-associated core domain-containing protein, partial [Clostridia bacterium]|nr:RHS repeat-associated core domain-containing protein [Clostridia bacterium]
MKKTKPYSSKPIPRLISFFLSVLIIFYAIPSIVFAEVADAIESIPAAAEEKASDSSLALTYTGEAYEIEEAREESAKHFHLEDGSYIAAQYPYPVHYVSDSGELTDIDNALTESSGEFSNKNERIKFAKKITGSSELFTLHEGNTKIRLSLIGAIKGTAGSVTNGSDAEDATVLQKLLNLERLSASVLYKDILNGVDLEYVASSLNIKENIIVKKRMESYSFSFELKLNGLTAELSDDGNVYIKEENEASVKYTIPAPIVFDASGNYAPSELSSYSLSNGGNGKYILTVTADSAWMNSDERAYPITVDPALKSVNSSVLDTSVSSYTPDDPLGDQDMIHVSSARVAHWKSTSLPTIPASAYITEGSISLYANLSSASYVGAYEVLSNWDESLTYTQYTSTTSPKGNHSQNPVSFNMVRSEYYTWNITPLVRKWYAGTNYGVAFDRVNGLYCSASFISSESAYTDILPYLTISYRDMKGIEDYYTYTSHSLDNGGTGSINLATGQLSFAIPTLTTTDAIMPITPTLVYNSALAGKAYISSYARTAYTTSFMPRGFKLSICESIISKTYTNASGVSETYYVYADADGTEHEFYKSATSSSLYLDEDGLQLFMTPPTSSNTAITITDDSKTVKQFAKQTTTSWILSTVTDRAGNKITVTSSSTLPSSLSFTPAGRSAVTHLKFGYLNGKLSYIFNPNTHDAVVLRYSSTYNGSISTSSPTYLRQVDYVSGSASTTEANVSSFASSSSSTTNIVLSAKASYAYDSSGRLTSVTDSSTSKKISYTWSSGKLTKISEYSGSTLGQQSSVVYGEKYADVRQSGNDEILSTSDDIYTRYTFDFYGRCVNAYTAAVDDSVVFTATSGEYEEDAVVKNNIKTLADISSSHTNYLLNGSFEKASSATSVSHWTLSGSVSRISEAGQYGEDREYAMSFAPTSGATAKITQYVKLPKGNYTLSFPYFVQNADGATASVSITSIVDSATLYSGNLSLNSNAVNGTAPYFTVPFDVTDTTDNIRIDISLKAKSGSSAAPTFKLYEVMLVDCTGSSLFSRVNYGAFESSNINSSGTVTSDISSYWVTEDEFEDIIVRTNGKFGDYAVIEGKANAEKYIKQRVYELDADKLSQYGEAYGYVGNSGYEYILTGLAQTPASVYNENSTFRLRADVIYHQPSDGSEVIISHTFDFVPGATNWQFTGGAFNTKYEPEEPDGNDYGCIKAIDIYCDFSYQSANAYFDNISLVNVTDDSVVRYSYYKEGAAKGMTSQKNSAFYKEYYEYDSQRNLKRVANNQGEITDYYYTSANQIDYTVDYDFIYNAGVNYPFGQTNPDSLITKTPKTKTDYTYTSAGLTQSVESYKIDSSLNYVSGTDKFSQYYSYEVTAGSPIFGVLVREYDSLKKDIRYFYDDYDGKLLATVNIGESTGYAYTYDNKDRLINVTPASFDSEEYYYTADTTSEKVTYTYDSQNRLSTITTKSTAYTFTYDTFGNAASISSDGNALASYTYNSNNGKLNKITYGNGFVVEYVYNKLEMLEEVWYTKNGTKSLAYEYTYTASGQVYKFINHTNGKTTAYKYDDTDKLTGFYEYATADSYHDFSAEFLYDRATGRLSSSQFDVDHLNGSSQAPASWSYSYLYEDDGTLSRTYFYTEAGTGQESFSYDDFDRISSKTFTHSLSGGGSFTNTTSFSYYSSGGYTSGLVGSYSSTVSGQGTKTYTYSYDADGANITKIVYSSGEEITYEYDELGQLVKEVNDLLSYAYTYTYDDAGNITSRTTFSGMQTNTYEYTGDRLTSFNGVDITYDANGNPLSYYNGARYYFTWSGRQLAEATKGTSALTFTYNDDGIRTSKTNNGVKTTYYLNGSQIVAEETSNNITLYIYDSQGSPIGMQYHGASYSANVWDTFWFEKNLQGDIVAVYSGSGTKLVEYVYDAWGNHITNYFNGGASTQASNNPFRYRGYYYDSDLELYCVGTRYYDSVIGRWVNPDKYVSTGQGLTGYNLYAYCGNNPVNRIDPTGEAWWHW